MAVPEKESLPQEEEWFDLLPAEKRLISYSLGLGVFLLVVLLLVTHTI